MRTTEEHTAINRMLMNHGLGRLEDGAGVLWEMAALVSDHEHFRNLLARCEPENRSDMYDAMSPYLRFRAKPLSFYQARSAELADQQRLPVIGPNGDVQWREKPVPEVKAGDDAIAQSAVERDCGTYHLVLVCARCTKQEMFSGYRKADAVQLAREAGWTYDEIAGAGREICPECPAVRPK